MQPKNPRSRWLRGFIFPGKRPSPPAGRAFFYTKKLPARAPSQTKGLAPTSCAFLKGADYPQLSLFRFSPSAGRAGTSCGTSGRHSAAPGAARGRCMPRPPRPLPARPAKISDTAPALPARRRQPPCAPFCPRGGRPPRFNQAVELSVPLLLRLSCRAGGLDNRQHKHLLRLPS